MVLTNLESRSNLFISLLSVTSELLTSAHAMMIRTVEDMHGINYSCSCFDSNNQAVCVNIKLFTCIFFLKFNLNGWVLSPPT